MGGRIHVESEVGQGSRFQFTIPMQVSSDSPAPASLTSAIQNYPAVVVEDNATGRKVLSELLRAWGMRVSEFAAGNEALEFLKRTADSGESLPLVICDVSLHDSDGFQWISDLRRQDNLRKAEVIVLTPAGQPADARRRRELRISAQLLKPLKQSELLKAIRAAISPPAKEQRFAEKTEDSLPELPSLRILLAEDGKANQKLAVGLLKKWGHNVTIAENGLETVDHWRSGSFDVILMDIQMPEMDGFEATRQIRTEEQQSGQHIPVIAMTAHAMKGDRERCLASGMDGYVSKPIRRRELLEALAEHVPPPQ